VLSLRLDALERDDLYTSSINEDSQRSPSQSTTQSIGGDTAAEARPASCIYEGHVRHRRFTPVEHSFRYRLFQMYLDLDEIETLFENRLMWSSRRPALARFDRRDHLGPHDTPLGDSVRQLVADRLGRPSPGPIRLLTHLRYFGYVFNPVSFYYLFDPTGTQLEAWVAHVSNTPWKESHVYVHDASDESEAGGFRFRSEKAFHVSPFLEMDYEYAWTTTRPGDNLAIHIENHRDGEKVFDATLGLKRREISGPALAQVLVRYPLMTLRVVGAIYAHAARLWWKRVPFQPHPKHDAKANRTI